MVKPGLAGKRHQVLSALYGVLAVVLCRTADACPSCTTRSGGGYLIVLLLGAMILTPYVVASAVLFIVRKGEAERALEDASSQSHATVSGAGKRSHQESAPTGGAPARA